MSTSKPKDGVFDDINTLADIAQSVGTPLFVYFTPVIATRATQLRQSFNHRFLLSFAVKSNPNPSLLTWMKTCVDYLDISSIGEFRIACKAGWSPSKLSFTGPGKREYELKEAIEGDLGLLVVESVREAIVANRIAITMNKTQDVLVRIAPSFVPKGFGDHMAGRPSPFGIDEENVYEDVAIINALSNINITGLHIYAGTQCLKYEAICENYRNNLRIFKEVAEYFDIKPKQLVIGSGLGIPYHIGDQSLDISLLAAEISEDIEAIKRQARFSSTDLVLELGRYLVGPAGYFLTRVVSVKTSRGRRIAICDGGMNHHLPAAGYFGMAVMRNYQMSKIVGNMDAGVEKTDLSGPLCTSIDKLARGVELPRLEEDDLIAIHNSGAYGPSSSPVHFISHWLPREVIAEQDGFRDVTWDFKI